ncbi:acyl carrier protein [Actinokineospora enzanensis]|uniref:acyl carrier protein n=1 Tax=Actinokineospora enzanensis TaxID=155975 RepID=UPI000368016B|nr:acyl carrier protein [Actinokineospora enzanensis]
MKSIGYADLVRLLHASAGVPGGSSESTPDTPFDDLGYDSIALLETLGAVEREYGVRLADDLAGRADTPRALLALINAELAEHDR